jgi:hypothetical protein
MKKYPQIIKAIALVGFIAFHPVTMAMPDKVSQCLDSISVLSEAQNWSGLRTGINRCSSDIQKALDNSELNDQDFHHAYKALNQAVDVNNQHGRKLPPVLLFNDPVKIEKPNRNYLNTLRRHLNTLNKNIANGANDANIRKSVDAFDEELVKMAQRAPEFDLTLYSQAKQRLMESNQANVTVQQQQKIEHCISELEKQPPTQGYNRTFNVESKKCIKLVQQSIDDHVDLDHQSNINALQRAVADFNQKVAIPVSKPEIFVDNVELSGKERTLVQQLRTHLRSLQEAVPYPATGSYSENPNTRNWQRYANNSSSAIEQIAEQMPAFDLSAYTASRDASIYQIQGVIDSVNVVNELERIKAGIAQVIYQFKYTPSFVKLWEQAGSWIDHQDRLHAIASQYEEDEIIMPMVLEISTLYEQAEGQLEQAITESFPLYEDAATSYIDPNGRYFSYQPTQNINSVLERLELEVDTWQPYLPESKMIPTYQLKLPGIKTLASQVIAEGEQQQRLRIEQETAKATLPEVLEQQNGEWQASLQASIENQIEKGRIDIYQHVLWTPHQSQSHWEQTNHSLTGQPLYQSTMYKTVLADVNQECHVVNVEARRAHEGGGNYGLPYMETLYRIYPIDCAKF